MIRRCTRIALLSAALVPAAAPAQSPPASELQARADEIVGRNANDGGPGLVVAVVRGGQVVYRNAAGLASLEQRTPLTTSTILDIGSVAKQFTAFAVVLLESRGELTLDDDVRAHLPEVPDLGQRVTIRNLLQHTSGLREIYNTMMIGGWQAGDGLTQEQALRLVAAQPALQFPPGSEHLYNNTGYMLLADVVERATGTEFHLWMRDNVFRPLGMEHTVIMHTLGQVIPGSADSYARAGDGYTRVFDNSSIQGAGGVYSTIDDLVRWLGNWSRPAAGTGAVLERMQQRAVLSGGDTIAYALGVTVDAERGLRRIRHGGSSAGYRTMVVYYPDLEGGIVVQSNFAGTNTGRVAAELADVFFGDVMQPRPAADSTAAEQPGAERDLEGAPAWTPEKGALEAYAGRFYSPEVEAVYRLEVAADTLVVSHRRIGEVKLEPRGPDVFRAGSSIGELRFERDEGGRVTGFVVSNGRTRGVRFERMD